MHDKLSSSAWENQHKLAKMINGLEFIVSPGKPHRLKHYKKTAGDGFATYVSPSNGFFARQGSVTLYAGHHYNATHLQQIAQNLVNRLLSALPNSSARHAHVNEPTKPGQLRVHR